MGAGRTVLKESRFFLAILYRGISLSSALLVSFLLPVIVGFSDYGEYVYVMATVSLLSLIFSFGIPQASFELSLNKKNNAASVMLTLLHNGLLLVLVLIVWKILNLNETLVQSSLLAAMFCISGVFVSIFRSNENFILALSAEYVSRNGVVLCAVILVANFQPLQKYLLDLIIGMGVLNIILLFIFYSKKNKINWILWPRNTDFWLFYKLSFGYLAMGAGMIIIRSMDVIMLENHVSLEALGKYKLVMTVAFILLTLHGTIDSLYQSKMLGIESFFKQHSGRKIEIISFLLIVMLAILLYFSGKYLFMSLYGIDFNEIRLFFILTLLTYVLVCWFGFSGSLLMLNDNKLKYSTIVGMGAIMNIVLNYIFIPVYNETGAAIATFLSMGLIAATSRGTLSFVKNK